MIGLSFFLSGYAKKAAGGILEWQAERQRNF
jgi:hypothetical protein